LSWGRTLLALVVAELFIWRTWALSGPGTGGPGSFDYLGLCAAAAFGSTAVLFTCVRLRSRQLRTSTGAAPAGLMFSATAAVLALAASTVAAIALGP
jgi:hypothetical protein